MNEHTFPPSPNWYLSNILACTENDTVVYGSKNCIVIVKSKTGESVKCGPDVSVISCAHKERVTVIACSTFHDPTKTLHNCIASAGDDSVVKIWDLNTLSPILAHTSHVAGQKIVCMSWSQADPNLIISIDEFSGIVCWDLSINSTRNLFLGKLSPRSLACCPHKADLVAIGTVSGLVCIVSVKGNGKVLYRLRGHDSEVVSLSWCPVSYNIFHQPSVADQEPPNDLLLASGSKHRSVYIWRAGGDGRYEGTLNLPNSLASSLQRSEKGGMIESHWVCVKWVKPNVLLTGTMGGNLLQWDLRAWRDIRNKCSKGGSGTGDGVSLKAWRLLHAVHLRGLFSIACSRATAKDWWNEEQVVTNDSTDENCMSQRSSSIKKEHKELIWTTAHDRLLVACDMQSGHVVHEILTIGGIVYCIATSPIDSNRVAIGAGDAVIRVWNLNNPTSIEVMNFWQKIKGKVTALAWHPSKESWLAYGTNEGRVGLYDISSSNQSPVLFRLHHRHSLYSLCWGPPLLGSNDAEPGSKYTLYSCGDYEIMQYNTSKPDAEPKNLKNITQLSNSNTKKDVMCDLAWKPDYSMLAIGNENGTVQVLLPHHKVKLHTIYAHKKLIHCLAWHPEVTATDTEYSPYQHWLATASKQSDIKVFDLSQLVKGASEPDSDLTSTAQSVVTLSGHLTSVASLCWSPHISGQLVSVSYDETAQVWDVPKQQPLGNFSKHMGLVYCCAWSPLDPDLVMTGSADCTLRVWRLSTLTKKLPPEKKKQSRNEKKKLFANAEIAVATSATDTSSEGSDVLKKPPVLDNSSVPLEFAAVQTGASSKQKVTRGRSYFPVSAQQWNQGRALNLSHCHGMLTKPDSSMPSFFGGRTNMLQLLEQEAQHHITSGNDEFAQHMELWKGNLNETLREAARKNKLSDWLVSMAPMVSQRLWQECCQAYAKQLSHAGSYHKAVSYLLSCHKVDEAIELLTSNKLYREAVAIAKCRLDQDDPFLLKLIQDWSHHLAAEGNYELAAECFISSGELVEAANLLGRRSDEGSLCLATKIAMHAHDCDLATSLATQCIHQCLLHKNWDLASSLVMEHELLKHFTILIFIHKTINELLQSGKVPELPLLKLIVEGYAEKYGMALDNMFDRLADGMLKTQTPDSDSQLWVSISENVALSCCAVTSGLVHLVNAAEVCYQYQLLHPGKQPLQKLITWLAPQGPFKEDSIFKMKSDLTENNDLLRSLNSYLYAGLFHWIECNMTTIPTHADTNGELEQESLQTTGVESEKDKPSQDQPWLSSALPALEDFAACMMTDKDTLVYFQDLIEIKKWEHQVASIIAKNRQTESSQTENLKGTVSENCSADNKVADECSDPAANVGLQKLDELKKRTETFVTQRKCTANPLMTYCKFRNICQFLITEKQMEVVSDILANAEKCWQDLMLTK